MAFFRNSTINLLNLHYGIHSIALSGGAAFFAIYLLKSGIPVAGGIDYFQPDAGSTPRRPSW